MLSHLKYTLVFDEKTDSPELEKLFSSTEDSNNNQLLSEIFEEEKLGEVLARKEDVVEGENQM